MSLSCVSWRLLFAVFFGVCIWLHDLTSLCADPTSSTVFRVGVIAPLTGPGSEYGHAIRNSIQLALEDNKALATRVAFIFEDVPYDPKQAVSAFQNLMRAKRVDLTFVWGVPFCNPIAPIAEAMRVPIIVQCVHPEAARDRRYVIRFINVSDQYSSVTTRYLESQGLNRIEVVVSDNPYTEEVLASLQRNLRPGQTLKVLERVNQTSMDFRAVISRIRQSDAQVTGVLLSAGQISTFYRQRREQRVLKPTFGTNPFASISEIRAAAGSMDGAVFAANQVRADFIDRYEARFGDGGQIGFGALAYEFAHTLNTMLISAKPSTPDELLQAFETIGPQEGVAAGPYHYRFEAAYGRFFDFPVSMQVVSGVRFRDLKE